MATKRKRKPSAKQRQARSDTAHAIAALKKLGLIKPRKTTGKRKKPGGSAYKALKRFADIVNGKSVAVKATKKARKKYKGTFDVKGERIIVPKTATAEKIYVSKKSGEIIVKRNTAGKKTKDRIVPKNAAPEDLPQGKDISYSGTIYGHRIKIRFKNHADLMAYVGLYDSRAHLQFIEVVEDLPTDDNQDINAAIAAKHLSNAEKEAALIPSPF